MARLKEPSARYFLVSSLNKYHDITGYIPFRLEMYMRDYRLKEVDTKLKSTIHRISL